MRNDALSTSITPASDRRLGHAITVKRPVIDFAVRKGLCFVGYLASEPNNDALLHFFREIYPLILAEENCQITLAGVGATPELLALTEQFGARVHWAGFVDDLSTITDAARIFIAPHRFAAGVPLKVIEAMAHGIPCVISQLLATQLDIVAGSEALVASSPEEFSTQAIRLLRDDTLWRSTQERALAFVERHYGAAQMRERLGTIIEGRPS